jgi:predicted transposase YdaD
LPKPFDVTTKYFDREASVEEGAELWTATYVLMGLRYPGAETAQLLRGVRAMRESVTFQAILQEGVEKGLQQGLQQGKLQEAINVLMRLGCKRFGPIDSSARIAIEQITDLSQIENFHERLLEVNSWNELLASPGEVNGKD